MFPWQPREPLPQAEPIPQAEGCLGWRDQERAQFKGKARQSLLCEGRSRHCLLPHFTWAPQAGLGERPPALWRQSDFRRWGESGHSERNFFPMD